LNLAWRCRFAAPRGKNWSDVLKKGQKMNRKTKNVMIIQAILIVLLVAFAVLSPALFYGQRFSN
jgi:hypothetical protein